jgi:hypothetical protein
VGLLQIAGRNLSSDRVLTDAGHQSFRHVDGDEGGGLGGSFHLEPKAGSDGELTAKWKRVPNFYASSAPVSCNARHAENRYKFLFYAQVLICQAFTW